jgi:hypothetical protein
MAILYIAEYGALTQLPGDAGQMPDENTLMAEQVVVIGAGSLASAALNPGTKYVRLNVDSLANIKFGFGTAGSPPAPVAIANVSQRFAINQTEFKGVPTNGNGSGAKQVQVIIAVIAAAL